MYTAKSTTDSKVLINRYVTPSLKQLIKKGFDEVWIFFLFIMLKKGFARNVKLLKKG